MTKVLVVIYSYTGTSRRVAQLLRDGQGWEVAEIAEVRPRSGALGNMRCLLDSLFRRCPAIRYDGPLPRGFDTVVLVSPVWGQQLAGPMRSFVTRRRDHLPDVAVVSVMGGSGAPNAIAEIGRIIGRAPILSIALTTREVQDGSCAERLQRFGTAVRLSSVQRNGRTAAHAHDHRVTSGPPMGAIEPGPATPTPRDTPCTASPSR
jgi:hypothetical protein